MREPHSRAFLILGSNIQPEVNLPAAVALLAKYGQVRSRSRVWETTPIGDRNQPRFLNAAVLLETAMSAQALKQIAIVEVEGRLGRVRDPKNKNGPRTIDIDIALYDSPHETATEAFPPSPEIYERPFVAMTLADLDPQFVHPETGETLEEIAGRLRHERSAQTMVLRRDVRLSPHVEGQAKHSSLQH